MIDRCSRRASLPDLAHQLLDVGPAAPERLHRKRPQHDVGIGTRVALLPDGLRPPVRGMRLARLRGLSSGPVAANWRCPLPPRSPEASASASSPASTPVASSFPAWPPCRPCSLALPQCVGSGRQHAVEVLAEMVSEDPRQCRDVRQRDLDLLFEPAGAQQGRIDVLRSVCRADDDDAFGLHRPVDQFQHAVDDGVPVVAEVAGRIPSACRCRRSRRRRE